MASTETTVPQWTLGWRLQRSLEHSGATVTEMGEYLGLSRSQLSRYLHDKGTPPRDGVLRAWALRCGVPYQWLRYGEEEGPTRGNAQSRWKRREESLRHRNLHALAA